MCMTLDEQLVKTLTFEEGMVNQLCKMPIEPGRLLGNLLGATLQSWTINFLGGMELSI